MTITSSVDLRAHHGDIRSQGRRRTCLAFALSDINGNRHQKPGQLSPDHLYREAAALMPGWKPHTGLALDAALRAVLSPGQALEADVPYADEPTLPLTPNPPCPSLFTGSYVSQQPLLVEIKAALAADRSVGLVLRMTQGFYAASAHAPQIPYSPHVIPGELHAVVAVGMGFDDATNEQHFLIRNSWGSGWAAGGHAWLSEAYAQKHTLYVFGD